MKEYRNENLQRLALKLAGRPDAQDILRQVEGWQRISQKVPSWAAVEGLRYPHRLALEQCSGEAAAKYKANLVKRIFPNGAHRMADLTGGFGVDFSFVARNFEHAIYVERQTELCELATHNFPILGLHHVEVKNADSIEVLSTLSDVDLLFLDPARRDGVGRKVVLLEDCEPNVVELLPHLMAVARCVVLKLSTMLDFHQALKVLSGVSEVHVFAERGECKDLLLVLQQKKPQTSTPTVYCVDDGVDFSFTIEEENSAVPTYWDATQDVAVSGYLYEPSAAILKAGAFKCVALRYGIKKLHPNSHLYVSENWIKEFPGRGFKILRSCGFSKKELKSFVGTVKSANLTVRNFPSTVAELRKRLKVAEGGEEYWFATTLNDGTHSLIATEKVAN